MITLAMVNIPIIGIDISAIRGVAGHRHFRVSKLLQRYSQATRLDRASKTTVTDVYRETIAELVTARIARGWTQADLARKWKRNQSVIAKIETCERRLDMIEFIDLCVMLGLDPHATIGRIHEGMRRHRDDSLPA